MKNKLDFGSDTVVIRVKFSVYHNLYFVQFLKFFEKLRKKTFQ